MTRNALSKEAVGRRANLWGFITTFN